MPVVLDDLVRFRGWAASARDHAPMQLNANSRGTVNLVNFWERQNRRSHFRRWKMAKAARQR